jgi:glucose/arabinose dehydrogenase
VGRQGFPVANHRSMQRSNALLFLAVLVLAGCTSATAGTATSPPSSAVASSFPASAADAALIDIGSGLKGPAGLAATIYATGLPKVSAFAFDADGRLWAATAGYQDDGTDAVYLIASAGATPVKVIGDAHTPLGIVWAGDTLYVASAGRVDAYGGLTGTAFRTHATVLTLPAGVGEVNGLVLSPAGRLVLGISAPCDACTTTTAYAAAVVSFLPDGSDLRVEASGIRAPVGLAYYPGTSDLFVTMNQRDDLGDATPGDWLAVVRSGQSWGFPDCYGQGGTVCEGVPTPIAELDKHAAVTGIAIVTGQLGADIGSSALVAEWATGTVMRVGLSNVDGTYVGSAEPLITGITNPVPVVVAPDGAVLVGDWGTGTIYRIATS